MKNSEDIITCCQHDLKTLGFTVIEESDPNANGDMFIDADTVIANGGEEETNTFFQAIFDEIDALGNKDGKLSIDEIKTAYQTPGLADTLQKIVAYHPTEWKKGKVDIISVMAGRIRKQLIEVIKQQTQSSFSGNWAQHWEIIKHLAINADVKKETVLPALQTSTEHNDPQVISDFTGQTTLHFLQQEQQRIDKLVFWDEVNELKNLGDKVWHFHPLRFIDYSCQRLIDVEAFIALYKAEHTNFAADTPKLNLTSEQNLRKILLAINEYYQPVERVNLYHLAYMLATVRHETYHIGLKEYFSETAEYGSVSYFNKYDPVLAATEEERIKARAYGNIHQGDGYKYRGRGVVQLTWYSNYKKMGDLLHVDLVNNPDLAVKAEYAIPIMIIGMERGLFTGLKLSRFINQNKKDYHNARKVINGVDKAALIASYVPKFEYILRHTSQLITEEFD